MNVRDEAIQDRQLANLANVDPVLCEQVAANLGRPVPAAAPVALDVEPPLTASPALSMVPSAAGPIDGRVVGMLVGAGVKAAIVDKVAAALDAEDAVLHVIGPRGGIIGEVEVHHTYHTCDSVMFDALVVDPSASALLESELKVAVLVQDAFRHHKAVAAVGDGAEVLDRAGIPEGAPGVVVGGSAAKAFTGALVEALGWHRHWDR